MIDVEEKSAYFIAINDYGYDKEQQQKAKQRGKEFIKLVHEENMTPFDALVKLNKIPKDFYIREHYCPGYLFAVHLISCNIASYVA